MNSPKKDINRRNFLKVVGTTGVGSILAANTIAADSCCPSKKKETKNCSSNEPKACASKEAEKKTCAAANDSKADPKAMPHRKLGRADTMVPILSNGKMFDTTENKIMMRASLQHGVTYWDTAYGYIGSKSEMGIGDFFKSNPETRKDVFLVTKASGARTIDDIEQRLQESLKRMNTNYIDLYYCIHACSDPNQLKPELAEWAKSAKDRGLIKYVGFSTHENMEKCLMAASKLDWIDGIMTSYNVSLMVKQEMQDAVQACNDAGIALIAMKVVKGVQEKIPEAEQKLIAHFLDKGYTRGQALIKAVLEDKRFCAACIRMENITILKSNVDAVLDKAELTAEDKAVLKQYAAETCTGYCAGCSEICTAAAPDMPYTAEVMRYLMYYKSYGDTERARELFAQLPADARNRLTSTDFSLAEARCPQHMPIAQFMAEASHKLA